ncbi:unnamed protein product [Pleuronectes platessa]|uniref:Uncharacterized protein n=1 Tax=Pleuronectes platessa TaxID=8262 RepID=A0A9N7V2Z5_PLEPL|nr:unnamed protein product [Pleuronectes platessa]
MKAAECVTGAAPDGHVLTGGGAGDEQEENQRSSALPPEKQPNWLTCQAGSVHPEAFACKRRILHCRGDASGDGRAVQNRWQERDERADWLQVGQPAHLNRLD